MLLYKMELDEIHQETSDSVDEDDYNIFDLPSELLMVISSHCVTHKEVNAMRCTCTFINNCIEEHMSLIKLGEYTLNTFQNIFYRQILNTNNKETHIKMPMSSGKTALGIAVACKYQGPAIIVIHSSTLDHWVNEFNKIFPRKEERSFNLYISHGKYGKLYSRLLKMDTLSDDDIVLCTNRSGKIWPKNMYIGGKPTIDLTKPQPLSDLLDRTKKEANNKKISIIAIFDEIHMKSVKARYDYLKPKVDKIVTLSADNTKALSKDINSDKIVINDRIIKDCIPDYQLSHEMMEDDIPKKIMNMCTKIGMPIMLIRMMYSVQQHILKCKNKALVFMPSINICVTIGNLDKYTMDYLNILSKIYDIKLPYYGVSYNGVSYHGVRADTCSPKLTFSRAFEHFMLLTGYDDYTIMSYSNMISLNKFESLESNKCVLFTTPKKVQVGININSVSDVLFMITPFDTYSKTTYSQCIGRFCRVNNMNKIINIHNIIYPIKLLDKNLGMYKLPTYLGDKTLLHSVRISLIKDRFDGHNNIYINSPVNGVYPLYTSSYKYTQKYKSADDYISDKYIIYGDKLQDEIYDYYMKNYTRSLFIDHALYDEFVGAVGLKSMKLCMWKYINDGIDPYSMSDEEYLYLAYAKHRTKKYRDNAKKWLLSKKPSTNYIA